MVDRVDGSLTLEIPEPLNAARERLTMPVERFAFLRELQPSKALIPIETKDAGKVNELILEQFMKAQSPMERMPLVIVTVSKDKQ